MTKAVKKFSLSVYFVDMVGKKTDQNSWASSMPRQPAISSISAAVGRCCPFTIREAFCRLQPMASANAEMLWNRLKTAPLISFGIVVYHLHDFVYCMTTDYNISHIVHIVKHIV